MVVRFARESGLDEHYCQPSPSPVSFTHVGLPTVEHANVQLLLFLLYVCLFWRGEAKRLGIQI